MYATSEFWVTKIKNIKSCLILKDNLSGKQLIQVYKSLPRMGKLFIRPFARPSPTQIDKRDDIIRAAVGENYILYMTIGGNLYLKENTKSEIIQIDLEGKIPVQFSADPTCRSSHLWRTSVYFWRK